MSGAFLISRNLFQNDLWQDVVAFRLFFYIVGNAVFSPEGVTEAGIHLERGQYLRSLRNLQKDLSYREGRGNAIKTYPLSTIQSKIKKLEKEERITTKKTEYGTLFTVVNYASYQDLGTYRRRGNEQLLNNDCTDNEQTLDNNNNVKQGKEGGGATLEDVYDFYANNFGMLNSFISEDIGIWCDDLSPDLVIAAMKIALRQGKPWGYARGPLKAWYKAGVKTLEDARAFEKQRQRDMNKNKGFSYRQGKEEKRKKMREKILEESE